jgi:hypothetical protein
MLDVLRDEKIPKLRQSAFKACLILGMSLTCALNIEMLNIEFYFLSESSIES